MLHEINCTIGYILPSRAQNRLMRQKTNCTFGYIIPTRAQNRLMLLEIIVALGIFYLRGTEQILHFGIFYLKGHRAGCTFEYTQSAHSTHKGREQINAEL